MNIEILNCNYYLVVEDRRAEARIEVDHREGCTHFVSLEIIINNLRICKFYLSEVPKPVTVQSYVELVASWYTDKRVLFHDH